MDTSENCTKITGQLIKLNGNKLSPSSIFFDKAGYELTKKSIVYSDRAAEDLYESSAKKISSFIELISSKSVNITF